jgi:hypothetical protein
MPDGILMQSLLCLHFSHATCIWEDSLSGHLFTLITGQTTGLVIKCIELTIMQSSYKIYSPTSLHIKLMFL